MISIDTLYYPGFRKCGPTLTPPKEKKKKRKKLQLAGVVKQIKQLFNDVLVISNVTMKTLTKEKK